jgi:hypothetical protein
MNTCDTCKHWKPGAGQRRYGLSGPALGDCGSPKWLEGYSVPPEDFEPDSVLVEDDEGWAFMTGPKFGCIHWAKSE